MSLGGPQDSPPLTVILRLRIPSSGVRLTHATPTDTGVLTAPRYLPMNQTTALPLFAAYVAGLLIGSMVTSMIWALS